MKTFQLWVPGVPIPQGSMRSPKAGVVLHNSPSLKAWRESIGWLAKERWTGPMLDEPCQLIAHFYLPPPKKRRHADFVDTKPDLDKLIRALGDALQGVVIKDDSRISSVTAMKMWAEDDPGVFLTLERLTSHPGRQAEAVSG